MILNEKYWSSIIYTIISSKQLNFTFTFAQKLKQIIDENVNKIYYIFLSITKNGRNQVIGLSSL